MIEFCGRCGGNRVKNPTKKLGPRCTGCGEPSTNPFPHKKGRNAGGYNIQFEPAQKLAAEAIVKSANGTCIGIFPLTWAERAVR